MTEYALNIDRMLMMTRVDWPKVGPDFDMRMLGQPEPSQIVPLPMRGDVPAPDVTDRTEWALAQAILHAEALAIYGSWLRALKRVQRAGGRLELEARSRFHGAYVQTHLQTRVLAACQAVEADVDEVVITA